jgi:membrane fusion protein, multidrug efflux system
MRHTGSTGRRAVRKTALFGLAAAACLAAAGCQKKAATGTVAPPPPPTVIVTEAVKQTVPIWGDFVARTAADEEVELRARVEGFLEKVHFDTGDPVPAGAVVFEIEKSRYAAAVEAAKARSAKADSDLALAEKQVKVLEAQGVVAQNEANLLKAKQDVERIRPLVEQRAVSKQDLDASVAAESVSQASLNSAKAALKNAELTSDAYVQVAKAEVMAAKANLSGAQLDLDYTTIKAPIGGILGKRNVDPGNLVGRGDSTLLATIVDSDPIRAVFTIPETDYLRLKKLATDETDAASRKAGLEFALKLADGSNYPEKGKLGRVEATVDLETGTLPVEANFPNAKHLLKPGQFGRVLVVLAQRENSIVIPQRSVLEIQGTKMALVVGPDNKVVMRSVTIGDRTPEGFVVTSGLEAGERVIVEGVIKVRPGMLVNPVTAGADTRPKDR